MRNNEEIELDTISSFYMTFDSTDMVRLVNRAVLLASARSDVAVSTTNRIESANRSIESYKLRMHQQYSFAFICLIFFFIGAPLGAIIRKGGYGYSLLVAILFYMIFIISSIVGEKLLRNGTLGGVMGAWLPCLLLSPFAIIFMYNAINDVKVDFIGKIKSLMDYV